MSPLEEDTVQDSLSRQIYDNLVKHYSTPSASIDDSLIPLDASPWTPNVFQDDYSLSNFFRSGFQASELRRAIEEVRRMLQWKPSQEEIDLEDVPPETKCTVWLSFTSNLMYSGLREIFTYLSKNKLIHVFVTTSGAIEADLLRCLAPVYTTTTNYTGAQLSKKHWSKVGNIIIPNSSYKILLDWITPHILHCIDLSVKKNITWTPSKLLDYLGKKIHHPSSFLYWCHHHGIPVFCPGITDGTLGTFLYMISSLSNNKLILDIVQDIRKINDIALHSKKSGVIILGGGIAKHHICNANLMRNGADFAVYINTAQAYDGSDSGANPDEAVSWGKIRASATPVKLYADATLVFPILVASTFSRICACS